MNTNQDETGVATTASRKESTGKSRGKSGENTTPTPQDLVSNLVEQMGLGRSGNDLSNLCNVADRSPDRMTNLSSQSPKYPALVAALGRYAGGMIAAGRFLGRDISLKNGTLVVTACSKQAIAA